MELVRSVDWSEFPGVCRLICESSECGKAISRSHRRRLRNGYVEDLAFTNDAESRQRQ